MGSAASSIPTKCHALKIYDISINYYSLPESELVDIIYNALKKYDVCNRISKAIIIDIQSGYTLSNTYYHCFAHATYVFQTMFILCEKLIAADKISFSYEKLIGFLLIGLCHDLGHIGTINTYIDTNNADTPDNWKHSHLEYMHFTKFTNLVNSHESLNSCKELLFFENNFVMDLFKYTNLSQHFQVHNYLYDENGNIIKTDNIIIIIVLLFADISSSSRNSKYNKTVHTALQNEAIYVYGNNDKILNEILTKIKNHHSFVDTFIKPLYNYLSEIIPIDDIVDVSLI